MKQVTQNMRDGKTTVEDVPIPTPRSGQALIRVASSLVSAGTERMLVEFGEKSLLGKAASRPDLVRQVADKFKLEGILPTIEATFNRLNTPMPLGYSSAGTIVELGSGMNEFHIGQRVACAGGGYAVHAEYNIVPKNLITPIPDQVSLDAAAFTTLGAISLHGFRLAETQLNDNVAVIGLGLLGLLTAQLAKAAGCKVFGIDTQAARVELAQSFGIQACLRQTAEQNGAAFTSAQGFDAIIICADTSANDPVELAGVICRDRGKVVATGAVGLNIPRKVYYEKEISFINSRSYGPGRYDQTYEEKGVDYPLGYIRWTEGRNFGTIIDLIANGSLNVDPLISHRFPIEEADQAYELITGKTKKPFLGVLLHYSDEVRILTREPIRYQNATNIDNDQVQLGVIGAGNFANATLLPRLKKLNRFTLVGISSNNGLSAAHSAKKFGFQYATTGAAQIITDPKVNAVAILTRHNSHTALSIKALSAGKHVFVEKPLAMDQAELDQIRSAISQPDSPLLMVGYNRRFAPHSSLLKKFLSDRAEPVFARYTVNAGYIPKNSWVHDPEVGGGRMIGEGCHFIDLLTYLIGTRPISVRAAALPDSGKYQQDNMTVTMRFEDGSIGVLDYLANGDKSHSKERVEVFCGGSVAILNDFRELTLIRDGSKQVIKDRLRQDKGHQAEMAAFVEALKTGIPPIPYGELIAVSKATFAAMASLSENGDNIDLE